MARVLIADDMAGLRQILASLLRQHGYVVVEAADGLRALELLTTEQFTVAVLDVMMPGIDGLSICRRLRSAPDLHQARLAVMSGSAGEAEALAAGADAYLSKPFQLARLLAIVRDLEGNDYLSPAAEGMLESADPGVAAAVMPSSLARGHAPI